MKSTAVLLAICAIAALAVEFDCGELQDGGDSVLSNDSPNSTTCCKTDKKTCASEFINGCNSDEGFTYDSTTEDEENPSEEICCKATNCGRVSRDDAFQCPTGKWPSSDFLSSTGLGPEGRTAAICCQDWNAADDATCGRTKDGTKEVKFTCPAGKEYNRNNHTSTTVDEDWCCKDVEVVENFNATCANPTATTYEDFDCYAVGMQYNDDADDDSPRNKETCCEPFVSTCARPKANSAQAYQCGEDLVYKKMFPNNVIPTLAANDNTDAKNLKCCEQPTCGNAFDATCGWYEKEYANPCGRSNLVADTSKNAVIATGGALSEICCKIADSTSACHRQEVAYSIFILAAISALA